MPSEPSPVFAAIRARILLGILLLTLVIWGVVFAFVPPEFLDAEETPLVDAVSDLALYALLAGFLLIAALRAGVVKQFTLGERPCWRQIRSYAVLAIPLVGVSLFGLYVVFLPLSYISPGLVAELVLEFPPIIWWRVDPEAMLANGINAILFVVVAPVFEEIFFRGFLLNRWWHKYGIRRAVIFSSLAFALLHVEVIGGFVFAVILSLIYVRTQSLIGPIIVHASNNAIVLLALILEGIVFGEIPAVTLEEFRTAWWMAAVGAVIGMPWLVWYCRRSFGREQDFA